MESRPRTWRMLSAIGITAAASFICFLMSPWFAPPNLAMVYLVAVAWAATRGRLEAILTSILSVLAFDFLFVPPSGTFAVSDVQYVVTFAVMLLIGVLISALTLRLKAQSELAAEREKRTAALYDVSKGLAKTGTVDDIADLVSSKSFDLFGCRAMIFLPDGNTLHPVKLSCVGSANLHYETAVAQWVAEHKHRAGAGTETLAGSKASYLPLSKSMSIAPVLVVDRGGKSWGAGQDGLLEAFASQVAVALERVLIQRESTRVQLEMERERMRNVLLSAVSHDLRTPLAAISGSATVLREKFGQEVPRARELIETIDDEAKRLMSMVRNVLDLSRIEAGGLRLNLEWESIDELVGSAVARSTSLLHEHSLTVNLPPTLPFIRIDATLIEQLFVNLLENVSKHTPAGTAVTIEGRVSGRELVLDVIDNGPGLPKGEESRVFEKLYRGNGGNAQGVGLGLTISQAIMKAHGGGIEAANRPEGGARLSLHLPLSDVQPEVPNG